MEHYINYVIYAAIAVVCFTVFGMIRKPAARSGTNRTPAEKPEEQTKKTTKKTKNKEKKLTMADVDAMKGHEFEHFCAELLKKNGFKKVSVTPGSGDQGVDITAVKGAAKYAIQCKRYNTPLGNKPVQEVYTGRKFYGCKYGAVMTNSTFTPHAKELAERTGVLLWDRKVINGLMRGDRKSI